MTFEKEMNLLTKKALRGDVFSIFRVLNFLWSYNHVPVAKYVAYALVYQIAMNVLVDVSRECQLCSGKCCREGRPLPLYDFDIEELEKNLGADVYKVIMKIDSEYVLPRPCPFQRDWRCGIHEFKPYACLSYPFATEDVQLERMKQYDGTGIPDIYVPSMCLAGIKVKKYVDEAILHLRLKLERTPTPTEIIQYLLNR